MSLIPWRNKRMERMSDGMENAMVRFREEFENLFDRFFRPEFGTSMLESWPARFGWGPRMDLAETDNDVTVKVEVPGIDPKDIDINVTGDVLTVRGEKRQESERKDANVVFMERQYGSFSRSVHLPTSVDPEKIDAVYKDGVLTITMGKLPGARPKKVSVRQA